MTKLEKMIADLRVIATDLKPYADKAYEIDGELLNCFEVAINASSQAANALKEARDKMDTITQKAVAVEASFPEER